SQVSSPSAFRQLRRAGIAGAAFASLALGFHWCRDFVAVDSCLDAGHVYDYAREACDTTALTPPVIPYSERHSTLILVAAALIVSGLGATLASRGLAAGGQDSTFSGFMAVVIMALAVWAVPGWGRLVLLAPIVAGAGWAIFTLRHSGGSRECGAAEQCAEADGAGKRERRSLAQRSPDNWGRRRETKDDCRGPSGGSRIRREHYCGRFDTPRGPGGHLRFIGGWRLCSRVTEGRLLYAQLRVGAEVERRDDARGRGFGHRLGSLPDR